MDKADRRDRPPLDIAARWARVTGVNGRFVLFDFTVADPDLTVELIMPYPALRQFCAANRARLSVAPAAEAAFERLALQADRALSRPAATRQPVVGA